MVEYKVLSASHDLIESFNAYPLYILMISSL
jgi:hypothetical protein